MSKVPHVKKSALKDAPRLSFFHLIALALLLAVVFGAAFLVKGIYMDHWVNGPMRTFTKIVPIPVASVNGETIFYDDVIFIADLIDSAGEPQEDLFATALEAMIRRKHMEQFAEGFGIDGDQLLRESDETVDQELLKQLGWSEKTYKKYVLRPFLIAQALELEIYDSDEYQQPARDRMQSILNNVELGINFTDLAIQHSEGGAAPAGGDIGYVRLDDLDEGLEAIFDLDADQYSDILEADTYFVVGYVYDVVEVEGERDQVGVQMITINKQTLAEAMEVYVEQQEVKILVR